MDVSSPRRRERAPVGARARNRAATRRRILASATALFADRGLHEVTSHDIAAGAGVAAGTFYLHFADKHAVFREIAFEAVQGLKARIDAVPEVAGEPARGAATRAEELLAFAEENRDLVSVLFGRRGSAVGLAAQLLEDLVAWCADDIRKRAPGASPRAFHPTVAAQSIVGMWARVLTWWVEDPGDVDRSSVVRTLVALQLSGTAGAVSRAAEATQTPDPESGGPR